MKVGIIGSGKMAQALLQEIAINPNVTLSGHGSYRYGENGLETVESVFEKSQCVIDFTTPEALFKHSKLSISNKTALIVGTTGLTSKHYYALNKTCEYVPVVCSPNMSIGANLLFALSEQIAKILDESFDAEILELHHRDKIDAPSGTAIGIALAIARGRNIEAHNIITNRTGMRNIGEIGIASIRGGSMCGDHTAMFINDDEQIEISHKVSNRAVFAKGAIKAALWCKNRRPALYNMKDVIGL